MDLEDIKTIGVLGGGVMGSGIAQATALAGYQTIVRDLNAELLEKARSIIIDGRFGLKSGVARGKITQGQMDAAVADLSFTTEVEDLKNCDLVIEAIPENMELKQKVFADLDRLVKKGAVLASNSSYLTHQDICKHVERKDRYLGMHWASPANVMKGVELIYTPQTSEEILRIMEGICRRLGKNCVRVKDIPGNTGYIGNRVYAAARREAQKIVDEGVASPDDVDIIMKGFYNWPAGPFEMGRGARRGWA